LVDTVAAVIDNQDIALGRFAEMGDAVAGPSDEPVGGQHVVLVRCCSDLAGAVIAVDVVALEILELLATVDEPSSE
jgi:hypothetical protein